MDALRAQEAQELARQASSRYAETVRISRSRFAAGDIAENELRKIELESLRYQTAVIDAESELDLGRQRLPPPKRCRRRSPTFKDAALRSRCRRCLSGRRSSGRICWRPGSRVPPARPCSAWPSARRCPTSRSASTTSTASSPPRATTRTRWARGSRSRCRSLIATRPTSGERGSIERAWLQVQKDVAGAVRRRARAQLLLDAFEAGGMSERAEAALRVAEHAYKAGAASLLELLEAQRTHLDTRAQYLRAQHEYRQSLVEVSHAVAGDIK
jgi:outer membrane protein TolC